jgi:serine/alanine adding enzyme
VKIVNSLDKDTWQAFIGQHPQANIFHTPEMFDVFSRVPGHSPSLWAAIDGDGSILALLLPVTVTLRNGLLYPWTTRAVAYGSVLVAPGAVGTQGLRQLLQEYSRSAQGKLLFTELRNLSPLADQQSVLTELGFNYEGHLNLLVNLDQSEDRLWYGLSKSCRQSIRTAKNKGTIIIEVTNQAQLDAAYQQLHSVYSRVQVPLAHFNLFKAVFEICGPREMCKIFIAIVGNKCIGASFNLVFKGIMLDWYAGTDRTYAAYNPGELLTWHSLQWGQAYGCQTFDFGGAGKPNEPYGPRAFKAKFGGELVNYGRNICIHSPFRYTISKTVYSLARKASLFSGKALSD